jgi:hypothetical protein
VQLGPHHPLLRSLHRTSFTVCFANHPHNLARLLTMPNHAFPALLFFSGKFGGCGSITGTIRGVLKVLSLGVILPYEAPTFKTAVHANTSGELFIRPSSSKSLPESSPFFLPAVLPILLALSALPPCLDFKENVRLFTGGLVLPLAAEFLDHRSHHRSYPTQPRLSHLSPAQPSLAQFHASRPTARP